MNITSLCTEPKPSTTQLDIVAKFVGATNDGQLRSLETLFARDALVNDQLRNFWGIQDIAAWLDREIVGEKVQLTILRIRKHYEAIIVAAEIRGEFEAAGLPQPMKVDLYFTVHDSKIVRLLVLLARDDSPEPEIRRTP